MVVEAGSDGTGSAELATVSFVLPVFNEVAGIPLVWDAVREAADLLVATTALLAWEVVLVDDGSTDGSSVQLDELAVLDPRCRVVHHDINAGIGAALRTGLATATGDLIVYTDADLPFDLTDLGRIVAPVLLGDADMVSGKRMGRAREGRWRAAQSFAYNAVIRLVFHLSVVDANFACKVANRRAVPDRLLSDSGFIDVEWLICAMRRGCRVTQVPVDFRPRRWGCSTLGELDTIHGILRDLWAFRHAERVAERRHGA